MRNVIAIVSSILRPVIRRHINRPGRYPVAPCVRVGEVDHRIIAATADRLHAECIARGLEKFEAHQLRGLFMQIARQRGHIQAYDHCTARAVSIVRERGVGMEVVA